MSWRNTPEIFFPQDGAAHGHVQEPTPGSAVEFGGESVCKNRPLVPRSNIAGSWARGGRVLSWPCCQFPTFRRQYCVCQDSGPSERGADYRSGMTGPSHPRGNLPQGTVPSPPPPPDY